MTDTSTAGAAGDISAIVDAATIATPSKDTAETAPAEGEQPESQPADPAAELAKLRNALSRKDRRIGTLTAREKQAVHAKAEIETELAKFRQTQPQAAPNTAPNANDPKFKTFDEFLQAQANWTVEQKFAERDKITSVQQTQRQEQAWLTQRSTHFDGNGDVAEAAFSDFTNVIEENKDLIADLQPHVQRALLEADNGAFALYDLAQEGKLENLNAMSPYQVAAAVARAEDKALGKSKQKQATAAPAPMSPSKGNGAGAKPLENFNADEIRKWMKS